MFCISYGPSYDYIITGAIGGWMIPNQIFFTKGVGRHSEKLSSFELALRSASIAQFNLVKVSSIFPPNCKIVHKDNGLKHLSAGEVVFCVLSENATDELHRLASAAIGLAIPVDRSSHGYLSEAHAFGKTEKVAGDYAEDLAAEMLATIKGLTFNPEDSWDSKRQVWRMSGQIYKSQSICQSAIGKNSIWTTVIAAAILVP